MKPEVEGWLKDYVRAWGEVHEVTYRTAIWHGPLPMFRSDKPVWMAEVLVGYYPYAAWGETKYQALWQLERYMRILTRMYPAPPEGAAEWGLYGRKARDILDFVEEEGWS